MARCSHVADTGPLTSPLFLKLQYISVQAGREVFGSQCYHRQLWNFGLVPFLSLHFYISKMQTVIPTIPDGCEQCILNLKSLKKQKWHSLFQLLTGPSVSPSEWTKKEEIKT